MFRQQSIRVVGQLTALVLGLWCVSLAQESVEEEGEDTIIKIKQIETELVQTPQIGSMNAPISSVPQYLENSNQWLAIEFSYEIPMPKSDEEGEGSVDEITFEVAIEGWLVKGGKGGKVKKSKSGDDQSVLLTGNVTYINIRKTNSSQRERAGIMFIHPDIVARYMDKQKLGSKSFNLRVSAKIKGKDALDKDGNPVYKDLKEKDEDWEKNFSQFEKISGLLLKKSQTPFAHVKADRYPMEKPVSEGSGR